MITAFKTTFLGKSAKKIFMLIALSSTRSNFMLSLNFNFSHRSEINWLSLCLLAVHNYFLQKKIVDIPPNLEPGTVNKNGDYYLNI